MSMQYNASQYKIIWDYVFNKYTFHGRLFFQIVTVKDLKWGTGLRALLALGGPGRNERSVRSIPCNAQCPH